MCVLPYRPQVIVFSHVGPMALRTLCLGCLCEMHSEEPYDEAGLCDKCEEPLSKLILPVEAEPWIALTRAELWEKCLKKREATYVAQAKKTVNVSGFPEELLENFMEQATEWGKKQDNVPEWDRESPRSQWRIHENTQAWLFTAFSSISFICGFHDLEPIWKGEESGARNYRQLPSGDVVFILPPMEVQLTRREVMRDVFTTTVSLTFSTGVVPYKKEGNCYLRLSPVHPDDTTDAAASLDRWPHLPAYDNYRQYCRWQVGQYLLATRSMLNSKFKDAFINSVAKASWEADSPPGVVAARLPPADFDEKKEAVPWQHPLLTRSKCAYRTFGDMQRAEHERISRQAQREREEAAYTARRQHDYELWCYTEGKRISLAVMNNNRLCTWRQEDDPRFNGEHARLGYVGLGPDPCEPGGARRWMRNFPATWQEHDEQEKKKKAATAAARWRTANAKRKKYNR